MALLKALRERHGFSQAELAKQLDISRQTLGKYEKTDAKLPIDIIRRASDIFGIDLNVFITGKLLQDPTYHIVRSKEKRIKKAELRIDIPQRNIDKFKELLMYILMKIGTRQNVGQTVIYKLLYFIDFDFYELYEEQLTGATYMKNTHGPTPIDFAKIVTAMEKEGELKVIQGNYKGKSQVRYMPFRGPNLRYFTAIEIEHVNAVLNTHGDKNAHQLSDLSHKDIPWITTPKGGIIPYEAVFYRTPETSVRDYQE
jgi:transcriptional regulator with XRE-family HTH domain